MKEPKPYHLDKETQDGTLRNLDALYQLFPSCFTEAKDVVTGEMRRVVDWQKLRSLLGEYVEDGEPEKYDFTWVGKRAAQREAAAPCRKTLRPCPEESVDWDTTQNLYIEGDNLEVLKLLQNSYMGKVKMIYIDPPYNTGNDFVYHDDFAQSSEEYDEHNLDDEGNRYRKNTDSNGRFHSDWCSMIYARLMVARSLLTEDGVIFISIDENELDNLIKLACEIFGEANYIGVLSVENNPKGRKNSSFISVSSEYCVIFARNKEKSYFIENVPKKASDMSLDENGRYVHNSGKRVLVGDNSFNKIVTNPSSDKNYVVYYNSNSKKYVIKKENVGRVDTSLINEGFVRYASEHNGVLIENTYTEEKIKELFSEGALEFSNDKIYEKNFSDTIRIKSQLVNREYEAIVRGQKKTYSMELTTTGGGTCLKNLFNLSDSPFSAPKNVGFLKLLISLFPSEPFYILDFFSGSSTTAHAIMQLNAEDGGKRRFIMIQYQENLDESLHKADTTSKPTIETAIKYCDAHSFPHYLTEIGKERIRLAGTKIKDEHPEAQDLDIGFRILKCDDSNFKPVTLAPSSYDQETLDLFLDNIKKERTGLDLLFDCMMRWGLELSLPYTEQKVDGCTIYNVDEGSLVACFDGVVTGSVIDAIAETHPLRVVFRDSSFTEAAQKMNLFELFKQKCGWTDQEVQNNVRVI